MLRETRRAGAAGTDDAGIHFAPDDGFGLTAGAAATTIMFAIFHGDLHRTAIYTIVSGDYSTDGSSIGLGMQRRRSPAAVNTAEELFGQVLREIRKEQSITQEDLAHKSGYHPTYIGQLERGQKSPSLRAIISLAISLNIAGSELVRRVETRLQKSVK